MPHKRIRSGSIVWILLTLLVPFSSIAQIYDPVDWSFKVVPLENSEFELQFKAEIEGDWHLYSQSIPENGPIPTSFVFNENNDIELLGKVAEPSGITKHDPQFQMELTYFEEEAVFSQKVKLKSKSSNITGEVTFMVCNDSMCLQPEYIDFSFTVKAGETGLDEKAKIPEESDENEIAETVEESSSESVDESGQIHDPVDWEFTIKKQEDQTYKVIMHASIAEGWHVYSQHLESDEGPLPTEITFEASDDVVREGTVEEVGELHKEYDPNFMMELSFYSNEVDFEQIVKLPNGPTHVKGEVYFMVCNDKMCLPPEAVEFILDSETGKNLALEGETSASDASNGKFAYDMEQIDPKNPYMQCGEVEEESSGLLMIFILGFAGGLLALITPCVFPMIPLTVSFFTKGSEDKKKGIFNASMYGFFIFMVYILLSLPFHLLDSIDPNILNNISTNTYLNVLFFITFIVFAISFFGYFEITLPSSWTTSLDNKASTAGGLLGTFFMALVLALVSFSCTGPILGSLLAESITADGGAMQLTAGMGGFGLALALPFALFAAFPGWLNTLPKSGGWLNSVKVVLGFVEVALAFKFLSTADLVEHWGLLKIEVFLFVWIATGVGLALYFFGKVKFPHDSPINKLGFTRISLGLLTVAFVIYLMSGFRVNEKTDTFTSLTLLSGLAPPVGYSWFYPSNCPSGLTCYHDYEEGLKEARAQNKPIMIDFTGYGCVNCRKMEEQVWSKKEIFEIIDQNYILISLYVDDREPLPEELQEVYTTKQGKKRKIKTIGDKWAVFQTETFENNSQPWYCLLTSEEELINRPVGYTPVVGEYKEFLECGIEGSKKLKGQESATAQISTPQL